MLKIINEGDRYTRTHTALSSRDGGGAGRSVVGWSRQTHVYHTGSLLGQYRKRSAYIGVEECGGKRRVFGGTFHVSPDDCELVGVCYAEPASDSHRTNLYHECDDTQSCRRAVVGQMWRRREVLASMMFLCHRERGRRA